MNLRDTIASDMKAAMRQQDGDRLQTIRLLRSAIQRKELDDKTTLDDDGVMQVIRKQVKQGRDAARQFEQGGRADLVEKELIGVRILESYLPAQLAAEEIAAIIDEAITQTGASSMRDMGRVMGIIKTKIQGNADFGAVSAEVKARLSA